MVNKVCVLRRRQKRKFESKKLKRQEMILNAKKETLKSLDTAGVLPKWIKKEKGMVK